MRGSFDNGCIDAIVIHADGVVAAEGWTRDLDALTASLRLKVDGIEAPPAHAFRVRRPDVPIVAEQRRDRFLGAVVEWVLAARRSPTEGQLLHAGRPIAAFALPACSEPAYGHLQSESRVLGREQIYGFGPPTASVSVEVVELALTLPPPILDFGCGAGALLKALRREGIEAYGVELDSERIRQHLLDEVKPYVTLYDGTLPTRFRTGEFSSVVASEVLEHIPEFEAALAEMARLATEMLLITVPDMSSIPRGFHHQIVPWHLLEATHVNFFTQESLTQTLLPHATRIEPARIGLVECDRASYYSSLAMIAERRRG